ncbi:MAG: hypothetical protein E7178_04745 [Erysipelotrichaceae bacterium]|nr:hypothetical protein [Erysipelotrichaceae bacterium]
MDYYKEIDTEQLWKDVEKIEQIEKKIISPTYQSITQEEVAFLKEQAESGMARGEFEYGVYLLVYENNIEEAEQWLNKFVNHSNGFCLYNAVRVFAFLGDEYKDWINRFLQAEKGKSYRPLEMLLELMKIYSEKRENVKA